MNEFSDSEVFRLLNKEKREKKEKGIQETINLLNKNKIEYSNTHTPNVVSIKFKDDFIQLSLKKQGKKVKYCQDQIWHTADLNILINQIKTK